MDSTLISDANLEAVLASDPGIAVAIVSREGEIFNADSSLRTLFGIDPDEHLRGRNLTDFFHSDFVAERLRWIQRVLDERKPLAVRHIFRGRAMLSTICPVEDRSDCVWVVSRLVSPLERPGSSERVTTELIDLGPLSKLSERELEVLVLLGHGQSVPETARMLHRSPRTIERHKEEIGRKLGASTIAEIVKIVNKLGLTADHLQLRRIDALRREVATHPDDAMILPQVKSEATSTADLATSHQETRQDNKTEAVSTIPSEGSESSETVQRDDLEINRQRRPNGHDEARRSRFPPR